MHFKLALIRNARLRGAVTPSDISTLLTYVVLVHLGIFHDKRQKDFESPLGQHMTSRDGIWLQNSDGNRHIVSAWRVLSLSVQVLFPASVVGHGIVNVA